MFSIDVFSPVGEFVEWTKFLIGLAIDFSVQSTLLIAVGLILAWLVGRSGAAVQSTVYRATLVSVIACSTLTVGLELIGVQGLNLDLTEKLHWSWLDDGDRSAAHSSSGLLPSSEFRRGPKSNRHIDSSVSDRNQIAAEHQFSNRAEPPAVEFSRTGDSLDLKHGSSESLTSHGSNNLLEILTVSAFVIWLGVSSVLLGRIASALMLVARLRRQADSVDTDTARTCAELARLLSVSPPDVLRSPLVSSPCLVGIFYPAILLPESMSRVTLRSVILHELAHLERQDLWWNLFRDLCKALFCFQPLLWYLSRRMEATAEEVCDDFVLRYGGDRQAYASLLVEIAELALTPAVPVSVGVVSLKSTLHSRVVRILDASRRPAIRVDRWLQFVTALTSLAIVATVVPIGLKSPVANALASELTILQQAPPEHVPKVDRFGDRLPLGADLRMGTLRFRSEGIDSLAFSPDGKHLMAATVRGASVRIWDIDTGRNINRLDLGESLDAVVLSPDGTRAIINRLQGISLLKLPEGERIFSNDVPQDNNSNFALSANASVLVSYPSNQPLSIWDTATGISLLDLNEQHIDAAQLSPNGRYLAMATVRGAIRVFDLHAGMVSVELNSPARVRWDAVAFPDDESVVACGNVWTDVDGKRFHVSRIEQWRLDEPTKSALFEHPEGEIPGSRNMVLSFDRTRIVTSHYNRVVVWDINSRRPLRTIPILPNSGYRIAISHDNRRLAFTDWQCKPTIWNLETNREEHSQADSHHDVVLSLDDCVEKGLLASTGTDGATVLWNSDTGDFLRTLDQNSRWTRDVKFFAGGTRVALCSENWDESATVRGRVAIVETQTAKLVRQWNVSGRATALCISPTENLLAVGIGQGSGDPFSAKASIPEIQIWDMRQQAMVAQLKNVTGTVLDMQFSSESELRYTTEFGAFAWSVNQARPVAIEAPKSNSRVNLFALGGSRLLSVSSLRDKATGVTNQTWRLLDSTSNELIWSRVSTEGSVRLLSASPDGRLAAAYMHVADRPKLVLFRLDSGKELQSYDLDHHQIRSLAFARDGKTLYSGMGQGDILRWDISYAHDSLGKGKP